LFWGVNEFTGLDFLAYLFIIHYLLLAASRLSDKELNHYPTISLRSTPKLLKHKDFYKLRSQKSRLTLLINQWLTTSTCTLFEHYLTIFSPDEA